MRLLDLCAGELGWASAFAKRGHICICVDLRKPRRAEYEELARVHTPELLDSLGQLFRLTPGVGLQRVARLPAGVSMFDATALAGRLGRMNAVNPGFDPNDRYNLWSGLIGGFFLQLSYFGTDQSQVGRYLTARAARESRLGLLFNGMTIMNDSSKDVDWPR